MTDDEEVKIVLKEYRESKKGHSSFTTSLHRSFHEESWSETIADETEILRFAKWYATRNDETLRDAQKEVAELRSRNTEIERDIKNIRSNLSWINSYFNKV